MFWINKQGAKYTIFPNLYCNTRFCSDRDNGRIENRRRASTFSTEGFFEFESIMHYSWPGNVRELIHAVEAALSESLDEPTIFRIHLPTLYFSLLSPFREKIVPESGQILKPHFHPSLSQSPLLIP